MKLSSTICRYMHYSLSRGRVYRLLPVLFVPILLFLSFASSARGISSNVVISQIKISGATANDEFVELFNASETPVNLAGWRLSRKSASATSSAQNLVASLSGTIAAKSYFLIAHPSSTASGMADRVYSASSSGIAADNTVLLYSDSGATIVDKVGFGAAQDVEVSAFATNPSAGQSIRRMPCEPDSDHNSTDFHILTVANPRNSQSPAESACVPSPTPTVTPTPMATPAPTVVPTISPSPAPTASPLPEVTPLPTIVPTVSPTSTPVATVIPSATPIATTAPKHDEREHRFPKLVCERTFRWYWFGRFRWWLPQVTCRWEWHHAHDD